MVHTWNPSYLGSRDRRIMVPYWSWQKQETLSEKQTKSERAGGMVQVVERLCSKHKTLSTIPSTAKK
jgi:hypothetical protein